MWNNLERDGCFYIAVLFSFTFHFLPLKKKTTFLHLTNAIKFYTFILFLFNILLVCFFSVFFYFFAICFRKNLCSPLVFFFFFGNFGIFSKCFWIFFRGHKILFVPELFFPKFWQSESVFWNSPLLIS